MAMSPADVTLTEVLPGSPEGQAVLRDYFRDIVSRTNGREATDAEVDAEMRGDPSDDLCPPGGLLLVARRGGAVIGCVGLRLLPGGLGEVTRVFAEPAMLAEPGPPPGPLTDAPGYYRPDQRFSPAVNDDRIAIAQRAARAAGPAPALARDVDQAWRDAWAQMCGASQEPVVRTRHGDRMLLTEFLRTRVLELAVHGLDLAAGLDRPPWLTDAAADVVEELVLPAGSARLREEAGWDRPTLVAMATGRLPFRPSDRVLVERHGLRRLALG